MTKPDGGCFSLEVSPDFCFVLIPRYRALFIAAAGEFAIITLVVCMLAAWEWERLSGFRRAFTAGLAGGAVWSVSGADIFLLPEYVTTFVNRWLRCRLGIVRMVGCRATAGVFYPGSAAIWRSKTLRLIFGFVNYCAIFYPGHIRRCAGTMTESLQWRNINTLCHDLVWGGLTARTCLGNYLAA